MNGIGVKMSGQWKGKILTDEIHTEKANGKPKRSRKHKAVNYNIHRYASKRVRLMPKALFIL